LKYNRVKRFAGYMDHDNAELIKRLQSDDTTAFDTVYWKYNLRIYKNITQLLLDEDQAQNILQDVFISLWESRASLDASQPIANWLFVVSYNKSLTFLKKKLKEPVIFQELDDLELAETVSTAAYREQQFEILEMALMQLSPQKKKVFHLCKMQGKTYAQTAEELHISRNTVKEYLAEAVLNIKEYIKNHAEEYSALTISFLFLLFK
jgi:RNA polymerase sigma factor (sigma-70 family)